MRQQEHYSYKTEENYAGWFKRYVLWHKERTGHAVHPAQLGAAEVEAFLTHLAVNRGVATVTQDQALNALVFLYREALGQPLEGGRSGAAEAASVRGLTQEETRSPTIRLGALAGAA